MSPVISYPDCVVVDVVGPIGCLSPLVEVSTTNDLVLVCFRVTEVPDFLLQVLDSEFDIFVVREGQGYESKPLAVYLSCEGYLLSEFLRPTPDSHISTAFLAAVCESGSPRLWFFQVEHLEGTELVCVQTEFLYWHHVSRFPRKWTVFVRTFLASETGYGRVTLFTC